MTPTIRTTLFFTALAALISSAAHAQTVNQRAAETLKGSGSGSLCVRGAIKTMKYGNKAGQYVGLDYDNFEGFNENYKQVVDTLKAIDGLANRPNDKVVRVAIGKQIKNLNGFVESMHVCTGDLQAAVDVLSELNTPTKRDGYNRPAIQAMVKEIRKQAAQVKKLANS